MPGELSPSILEARSDAPRRGKGARSSTVEPRLMSCDMAAQYLGVSVNTFRSLSIVPLNIGRRVLWDKRSLDIYVDRLGGQPLALDDRERAIADVERSFLERRAARG